MRGCRAEDETCSCVTLATGAGPVAAGDYLENGRMMEDTFASSNTGTTAMTACPDCRNCGGTGTPDRGPSRPQSDVSSIPRCRVIAKPGKKHGRGPAATEESSAVEGDTGGSEDNWAMQVWSFVCKPLARPPKVSKAVEELEEDVFEIGTPLGRGGFATVYLAKNLRTDELVAVKRFHPVASALPDAKKKAEMAARRALKEQRIWDGLTHRNVVAYKGCFFGEEGELNLVAEYIPGWSLADHLSQINKFPEHLVARITKQIVDGLDYLHREGVTHRDIKPANILVDPSGVIKLTDFGVSSALDVPTMTGNTLVGTPHFIAPEMIEGRPYNKSVDIWSLGCTVLELATGRRPYHDLRAHEALFRIAQDRKPPPIPSSVSPPLRDFLKTCWVWDPEKRPLTSHLKRHPFLAKL
jgi:serine/threonine protein kinase